MNISSLSLVRTLSLPARLSATSATAKRMNWPSQPLSLPAWITGLQHRWQRAQQRVERLCIAGEIAADERRRRAPRASD